jgi:hypothetical protein
MTNVLYLMATLELALEALSHTDLSENERKLTRRALTKALTTLKNERETEGRA